MSEKGRLLKNTGLIALGNFGAKMVSFLLLPLYTSILTTSEYGTYDYLVAMSAFLLPIATLCMQEAMFRFIIDSGDKIEEFKKVVSNAFAIVISGIGFIIFILFILSRILQQVYLFYVSFYILANALYSFSNNLLRGLGKMKEYAIISSGRNILQLILNVIMIVCLRWGMWGLTIAMCVSEYLAFIVVFCIVKLWKYIGLQYISIDIVKSLIQYSLPLIPNALCSQIIIFSDRLVITNAIGKYANGIYSISYKFPNIIETVYHYFYIAWSESASRVWGKGRDVAMEYYQSFHDMIDDVIFSVVLMMTAGMPILFRIFIHGDYIQGFIYIPILLFSMYFDSMAKFYSGVFTALKNTKAIAISTAVAAATNLIINVIFIQKIGLYAAAWSTLAANIVWVLVQKYYVRKKIVIRHNYKKIALELLISVVIIYLYNYDNWVKIVISIMVSTGYSILVNKEILKKICLLMVNKLLHNEV